MDNIFEFLRRIVDIIDMLWEFDFLQNLTHSIHKGDF